MPNSLVKVTHMQRISPNTTSVSKLGKQRLLPPSPKVFCAAGALGDHLGVNMALRGLELGVQLGGGEVIGGMRLTGGGTGFLDAMDTLLKPRRYRFICPGVNNDLQLCEVLFELDSRTAIIEVSQVLEPRPLTPDFSKALDIGSSGLGTLIVDSIALGARHIIIGISQTLNIDCGLGLLARLADGLESGASRGNQFFARDLLDLPVLNIEKIKEKLRGIEISVYCSSLEPLVGRNSSSSLEDKRFQGALTKWIDLLENQSSPNLRISEGSGAGGGIGFALAALGAKLHPGAEEYLKLAQLEKQLYHCDGIVCCTHHFDKSSFTGKAPWQAVAMAGKIGCQGMIVCASADPDAVAIAENQGVRVIEYCPDLPLDRQVAESFTRLQQTVNQYIRSGR
jgi:glycerate kinase